jgi:hypothetical protein
MKWATAQKHVALSPASLAHLLSSISLTWGLRPRLYSAARFAGSLAIFYIANLGLAPQVLFCRPLRGLSRTEIHRYHLNTLRFCRLRKINGISMERIVID